MGVIYPHGVVYRWDSDVTTQDWSPWWCGCCAVGEGEGWKFTRKDLRWGGDPKFRPPSFGLGGNQNFGPFLLLCADSVAFQINNASMFHDNINLRTWWEKSSFLRLEAECMRWDFLLIKLQEKWAEDINIDFNYDLLQILTFYTSPARRNTSSCKINPLLSHF